MKIGLTYCLASASEQSTLCMPTAATVHAVVHGVCSSQDPWQIDFVRFLWNTWQICSTFSSDILLYPLPTCFCILQVTRNLPNQDLIIRHLHTVVRSIIVPWWTLFLQTTQQPGLLLRRHHFHFNDCCAPQWTYQQLWSYTINSEFIFLSTNFTLLVVGSSDSHNCGRLK